MSIAGRRAVRYEPDDSTEPGDRVRTQPAVVKERGVADSDWLRTVLRRSVNYSL